MDVQYLNSSSFLDTSASGHAGIPTFFPDEGIKGCVHLERGLSQDESIGIRLSGNLCLDTTKTLSHFGALEMQHCPIDSKTILDVSQNIVATEEDIPFYIEVPSSLFLDLPASIDVATSNINSDFDPGLRTFRFLMASVSYRLEFSIRKSGVVQHQSIQEIRFLSSSSTVLDCLASKQSLSKPVPWKRRLPSLPHIASKTLSMGDDLTVGVIPVETLKFSCQSDAAATKAKIKLTFRGNRNSNMSPPSVKLATYWNLESFTDLKLTDTRSESRETSIELRKQFPNHSQQMTFSNWSRGSGPTTIHPDWTCEHDLWIIEPLNSWLTPTFRTSCLSQRYSIRLHIELQEKGSFNGRRATLEFDLPFNISYEQASVPSYTYGTSPPQYACATA